VAWESGDPSTGAVYAGSTALGVGRYRYRFVFADGGGPSIDNVAISATLIPEPGTALLLLSGLGGMAAYGRRRA